MGSTSRTVARPRKDWTVVKQKADAEGQSPARFLAKVLARHSTYEGAARELGVTSRALLNYRRRYNLQG